MKPEIAREETKLEFSEAELAKARNRARMRRGHVYPAVVLYRDEYRRGLLCDHADRLKQRAARRSEWCADASGSGGNRDSAGDSIRFAGWADRTHDEYGERFRAGTGFAGGRDHIWSGAEFAGVCVGIPFSAGHDQSGCCGSISCRPERFICFLFLIGGASRLARFNISHDPKPQNPGRPDRKYFVGMPIPAAAGLLAATVHFFYGIPVQEWWVAIPWMILVGLAGFLMVSTWRFWSGKEIDLGRSASIPTVVR